MLNIDTKPADLKKVQEQRFRTQLEPIFKEEINLKVHFDCPKYKEAITGAKFNPEKLQGDQVKHLCRIADHWDWDMTIERSGEKLRVEFITSNK